MRKRTCLVFGIFVGLVTACSLADLGALSSGDAVADADVAEEDATTSGEDGGGSEDDAALVDSGDEDVSDTDASSDAGDDAGTDLDAALDASDASDAGGASDAGWTPCNGAPVKSTPFVKPQVAFGASYDESSVSWSNEDDAVTENGQTANATAYIASKSDYLVVTDFPFGVADSIRVVGVELQIVRRSQGISNLPGNVADEGVGLVFKGAASKTLLKEPGTWSATATTITYGGPTQTFGETITGEDVNDLSNFGAGITVAFTPPNGGLATAKVDAIRMKLYYCE